MIEVSDAVIDQGIDRQGGNELLRRIAQRLDGENPPEGYDITDCYDLIYHKPRPEYERFYFQVKKRLNEIGLKLSQTAIEGNITAPTTPGRQRSRWALCPGRTLSRVRWSGGSLKRGSQDRVLDSKINGDRPQASGVFGKIPTSPGRR